MPNEPFIPKNILVMPNAGVPKAMAIAKEIHKHFIDIKVNSDIFAYDFDGKSENQSWLTAIWSLLSVAMARCCGQDIYALRKKCPFWAFKRAHSVFFGGN